GHFDGVLGRVPGGAAGQDGAQVGAGDDVAGLVGEAFEHGHGGGRQGPEFAVDGDGVAADLQVVAAGRAAGDGGGGAGAGGGGGRQGPEFAVGGDGVAADLQVVAAG